MNDITMGIHIRIDMREPVLQSLLQTYHAGMDPSNQEGVSITIEPLDVGDVHIVFGEHSILFERKSLPDLAASVKDNRYREQKTRLLASGTKPKHIIYILEGVPAQQTLLSSDFPVHGLRPSVVSGMMIYTMLRDGIHVINVKNTDETGAWIWSIAMKCLSNPEKVFGTTEQEQGGAGTNSYLQNIKVRKMDNITPESCYMMQLCQIPNISISTAQEISKRYPSMLNLLSTLSSIPNDGRIKLLTEIPMIGKKKAQIILSYLLPNEQKTA